MSLTIIVLTFNEAQHIGRCLHSVASLSARVVVVDSLSTDDTVAIARSRGADVLSQPFVNQAAQFNWALGELRLTHGWVFRMDADEIADATLCAELRRIAAQPVGAVTGYSMVRRIVFMERELRHGGLGNIRSLRLFAAGHGRSESRWMDEHIVVDGEVGAVGGRLVDHNLNNLQWWVAKHNGYASREVLDIHSQRLGADGQGESRLHGPACVKRWIKHKLFYRLPAFVAPLAYFVYRYLFRLGFLDGSAGLHFHFHQGLWYRFLVVSKLHEVRLHQQQGASLDDALFRVTGQRLNLKERT